MASKQADRSRYARVKAILNHAQGDTIPDYQGYRAFWMSIDTFSSAVLYGQRMIAPSMAQESPTGTNSPGKDDDSGCCGGGGNTTEADASITGPTLDAVDAEPRPGGGPDAQLLSGLKRVAKRGLDCGVIAYYQSYSNTYVSPARLDEVLRCVEPRLLGRVARETQTILPP